jgi:hypothetical protein
LPWRPFAGAPPQPIEPGGWLFFTSAEGETIEALADRLLAARTPVAPSSSIANSLALMAEIAAITSARLS